MNLDNENLGANDSVNAKATLRSANDDDAQFLFEVFFHTRSEECGITGWDDTQLRVFLKSQFEFQKHSHKVNYPQAEISIICVDGERIGRLIVEKTQDLISLVDISILPAFRNRGIGCKIISNLKTEALKGEKPVRLSVSQTNPGAFRLYQSLGFSVAKSDEVYISMEWRKMDE